MLANTIFYHQITRKIIVAFGSLFSDVKIKRENGEVDQTISVPIAYAPKEKWIVKLEQDPSHDNYTYTTLPRLSFEITNFSYDSSRKTNRNSYITCADSDGGVTRTFAPVPYNIDISLYALSKTTEDGLQIVEQILPFFAPEFTMSIKAIPQSNIITDIPIVLNSLELNDEYDGDFQTRRFVTYTMNFTLKAWMFGPVSESGVINKVFVNTEYANLEVNGDITTGEITSNWIEE
jgi:hypothetical protein